MLLGGLGPGQDGEAQENKQSLLLGTAGLEAALPSQEVAGDPRVAPSPRAAVPVSQGGHTGYSFKQQRRPLDTLPPVEPLPYMHLD